MDLILLKDVENLGFKDDIVDVKNGFGRNFLIPGGFAHLATKSSIKDLNERLKQKSFKEQKNIEDAKKIREDLGNVEVKVMAKTSGSDKLFGSIGSANLSDSLSKLGYQIDKKYIQISGGTVKRTGKYSAKLRLHREVNTELFFDVIPEKKKK